AAPASELNFGGSTTGRGGGGGGGGGGAAASWVSTSGGSSASSDQLALSNSSVASATAKGRPSLGTVTSDTTRAARFCAFSSAATTTIDTLTSFGAVSVIRARGVRMVAWSGKHTSIRRSLRLARRSARTVSRNWAGQLASRKSTAIHGRWPHAGSALARRENIKSHRTHALNNHPWTREKLLVRLQRAYVRCTYPSWRD